MADGGGKSERGTMEKIGRSVGGAAGKAADTAWSMGRPLVGALARSLGGWWSGEEAREAGASWSDEHDRRCRTHFQERRGPSGGDGSAGGAGPRSYEDARPYYQLGHTAAHNPQYRRMGWDQVEPELRRAFGEAMAGRPEGSDWPAAREYVSFGFEQGAR